jgi:hypothetical protein
MKNEESEPRTATVTSRSVYMMESIRTTEYVLVGTCGCSGNADVEVAPVNNTRWHIYP